MIKLLAVLGTRPEAIKMAPVMKAFSNHKHFSIELCVTAQHRSMLDQVLKLYSLKPAYDLNIMVINQTLVDITQRCMQKLGKVFSQAKPDWVLVQGDTNTTFAAAIAAFYNKISVAHIEAGLRTHTITSPWPEELNRQLTSRIANLHFAPTELARNNLLAEGIQEHKISVTGNTVIDALFEASQYLASDQAINQAMQKNFHFLHHDKKLILVTSHRRENFGDGLLNVCQALIDLSLREDVQIVYPVHLNPNIQGPVKKMLGTRKNIYLITPQDYLPFIYLMKNSYLILTDSGGIQEEAPSLGKPVLVARNTTERPEGITYGSSQLVGTDLATISQHLNSLLDDASLYQKMSTAKNPYGDGQSARRIVERFEHEYNI